MLMASGCSTRLNLTAVPRPSKPCDVTRPLVNAEDCRRELRDCTRSAGKHHAEVQASSDGPSTMPDCVGAGAVPPTPSKVPDTSDSDHACDSHLPQHWRKASAPLHCTWVKSNAHRAPRRPPMSCGACRLAPDSHSVVLSCTVRVGRRSWGDSAKGPPAVLTWFHTRQVSEVRFKLTRKYSGALASEPSASTPTPPYDHTVPDDPSHTTAELARPHSQGADVGWQIRLVTSVSVSVVSCKSTRSACCAVGCKQDAPSKQPPSTSTLFCQPAAATGPVKTMTARSSSVGALDMTVYPRSIPRSPCWGRGNATAWRGSCTLVSESRGVCRAMEPAGLSTTPSKRTSTHEPFHGCMNQPGNNDVALVSYCAQAIMSCW